MNQLKPQIELSKTSELVCEKCENNTFSEAYLLRRVSRFITGSAQDGIIPINVFQCNKCHHINDIFLPEELKNKEK